MKRKKKPNLPKFILSKSAPNDQDEFVRNADPSLILRESCDHLKLRALYIHLETHPELEKWLRRRVYNWLKNNPDIDDIKHIIGNDLIMKTIPRLAKTNKWIYHHCLDRHEEL